MRLALNRCAGEAFRLSREAVERIRCLKRRVTTIKHHKRRHLYNVEAMHQRLFLLDGGRELIERGDPDLVAVVNELGDRANGPNAALKIGQIPDGARWRITGVLGIEYLYVNDKMYKNCDHDRGVEK